MRARIRSNRFYKRFTAKTLVAALSCDTSATENFSEPTSCRLKTLVARYFYDFVILQLLGNSRDLLVGNFISLTSSVAMQEDLLAPVTYETFLTILHSGKVQDDFQHLANFRTSSNEYTQIPLAKYESRIDTDTWTKRDSSHGVLVNELTTLRTPRRCTLQV